MLAGRSAMAAALGLLWGSHGAAAGLPRGSSSHGALVGLSWGFYGALTGLPWGCHVQSCHAAPDGAIMELLCSCYDPRCGLYGNAGMLAVFWGSPPSDLIEQVGESYRTRGSSHLHEPT